MKIKLNSIIASATLLVAMSFDNVAHAGVVVSATRIVYPAGQQEVSVKLDNRSEQPALLQVWLDDGNEAVSPEDSTVPFVVQPPIFRMEAGSGQSVRVRKVGEIPATDRETLFWINVLEIPPRSRAQSSENLLQFAYRTRLKVFYRPDKLPYSIHDAFSKAKIRRAGAGWVLVNPTPYHLSVSDVHDSDSEAATNLLAEGTMAMPHGEVNLTLTSEPKPGKDGLYLSFINDYGATVRELVEFAD